MQEVIYMHTAIASSVMVKRFLVPPTNIARQPKNSKFQVAAPANRKKHVQMTVNTIERHLVHQHIIQTHVGYLFVIIHVASFPFWKKLPCFPDYNRTRGLIICLIYLKSEKVRDVCKILKFYLWLWITCSIFNKYVLLDYTRYLQYPIFLHTDTT